MFLRLENPSLDWVGYHLRSLWTLCWGSGPSWGIGVREGRGIHVLCCSTAILPLPGGGEEQLLKGNCFCSREKQDWCHPWLVGLYMELFSGAGLPWCVCVHTRARVCCSLGLGIPGVCVCVCVCVCVYMHFQMSILTRVTPGSGEARLFFLLLHLRAPQAKLGFSPGVWFNKVCRRVGLSTWKHKQVKVISESCQNSSFIFFLNFLLLF